MKYLGPWDVFLVPLILMWVSYRARKTEALMLPTESAYRFYRRALLFKIYGGLALASVYAFYYGGGDTTAYWSEALLLSQVMFHDFWCYVDIMLGNVTFKNMLCFIPTGRLPGYFLRDPQSYTVPRLVSPIALITVKAFFASTAIVSWINFYGAWRLYTVFIEEYPKLKKDLAIAILFIPSTLFWGSGILKDALTFTAACWFTYGVYNLFIKPRDIFKNIMHVLIASWVMISIKPYIFVALLPGSLLWVIYHRIVKVDNMALKVLVAPIITIVGAMGLSFVLSQTSDQLGAYGSVEGALEKAVVTQSDLKREAYQGHSFDIGAFEPTLTGVISKAPIAIFSGLFRPTLFEMFNVVIAISAVENTVIMFFFLYVLFRRTPFVFFYRVFSQPLPLFSFIFAIFFSFSVGLSTSNYGSLVRYKIPALPFFVAAVMIARNKEVDEGKEAAAKAAPFGQQQVTA